MDTNNKIEIAMNTTTFSNVSSMFMNRLVVIDSPLVEGGTMTREFASDQFQCRGEFRAFLRQSIKIPQAGHGR
jgi:hypothetical protein